MKTVEERLRHYSLWMGGHLIWCGPLTRDGYGELRVAGKTASTHRLAWETTYGSIPEWAYVLHLCPGEPKPCIEPTHLYLGTHADNARDMVRAGNHNQARKTRCKQGHELTEENTYSRPNGKRSCRACSRESQRRYRAHPRAK